MSLGLIGTKLGMTRLFDETGVSTPVTVLQVEPNVIAQLKTVESDGYRAVQMTTGKVSAKKVNKPQAGHFAKANIEAGVCLREFRLADDELVDAEVGNTFTVEHFAEGQVVDVQATSRGKGFAGCVKRHNFRTQDATHGNSLSHRAPGSIGMCQTPGRVFKGKKMAGQMGNKKVTTTGLRIAKIDTARHLILIKGAVPGAPGARVVVKPSVKQKGVKHAA